jgi:outer membrane protein TolC
MSKAEALDIALETRLAYIEIAVMQRQLEVLHDLESLAGQVVDASNAAVAAGGGGAAMAARAQVEVEKLKGEILGIEKKLEVMKQGFAVIIGADPDEVMSSDFVLPAPEQVSLSLEAAYAHAIKHRPELKAVDEEVGSLTAAKKTAKDSYYPMMTIAAGYTYKSDKLMGLMGKDLFMISAGISLPIWIGKYKAEVQEAEADIAEARLEKEEMELMIKEQVAQAYGGLAQLLAQYDKLSESVIPQITLAYDLQITSYSAASGSLTDVIDSLETLTEVSLMKVGLEGGIAKARARLVRALGTEDYGSDIKAGEKSPKKGTKS